MSFFKFVKQLWTAEKRMDRVPQDDAFHPVGSKAYNDQLRQTFFAFGDMGETPRRITHMASPSARADVKEQALRLFLQFDGAVKGDPENDHIVYEHMAEIASAMFDETTDALRRDLDKLNWDYTGWEATIEAKG